MTNIPATLSFEGLHIASADREAVSTVAHLRGTETVAIIRTRSEPDPDGLFNNYYRTVILTPEQEEEAEGLPGDNQGDGFEQVCRRLLTDGETLISCL